MKEKIWVVDCEGDSLTPTKFHCLCLANPNSNTIHSTSDYDRMRKVLTEADILIMHNGARWDVPNLERLLEIKITCKVIDTLALSWYLFPERNRHGIESWGNDFGISKPWISDWENLTLEEYVHRCNEDVRITQKLWNLMWDYLWEIYGSEEEIWKLLDYLAFKMHCARLQEESRWKVDIPWVKENLETLEADKEKKIFALTEAMPKVEVTITKSRPKRFLNQSGDFSKLGLSWVQLCSEYGHPPDYDGEITIVTGYEDGNPNSPTQLKDWLYSLGWRPRTFKENAKKEKVPQINLEHGKGICESIKELFATEPNLELLDGLSVLSHRIGILKGFLRDVDEEGFIQAQISGFTNTLRVQHTTVVNLPKVEKPYGEIIRGSLIAPDGYELCGSDLSSLEDRIKQHFIYPHDPDYVDQMNTPDFEPHLTIAGMAEMLTQDEIQKYKDGDKKNKPIRDIAKNGNYACQYGAGPARLMITCGITRAQAERLYAAYWELNKAVKTVASEQIVKTLINPVTHEEQMWLFNPVSKFWYSLRFMKDIFSTLVQGTASYVFDIWLEFILSKRRQLTGSFHDEFISCIKQGFRKQAEDLAQWAIEEVNKKLKLNRELGISVQFGDRYSEIH